jgi:hypothetical protein
MEAGEERRITFIGEGGTYFENVNAPITISSLQDSLSTVQELNSILVNIDAQYASDYEDRNRSIAEAVIKQVHKKSSLRKRIISAVKSGGIDAFEQSLNHPAASFLIGAIKDWKSTN